MNTTNNTNKKHNESFTMTGDWTKQSAELKKNFTELTEADLKFETGKEQDLLSRIQSRLGKKREEVLQLLTEGLTPGSFKIA